MKAIKPNSKLSIVSIHMGQKIARDWIIGWYIENVFLKQTASSFSCVHVIL